MHLSHYRLVSLLPALSHTWWMGQIPDPKQANQIWNWESLCVAAAIIVNSGADIPHTADSPPCGPETKDSWSPERTKLTSRKERRRDRVKIPGPDPFWDLATSPPPLGPVIYPCILTSNHFLFSLFKLISVIYKQESKLIQGGSILEGRGERRT